MIRLATAADLPQLRALFLAGPHGTIETDFRLEDYALATSTAVVNVNAGVINACVVADRDDSSSEPIVLYRLVFGAPGPGGLLAIIRLLRDIVPRMKALGYTRWMANIPQTAAFAVFRRYFEARWPYVHDDQTQASYDGQQETRIASDTLDNVLAVA